MTISLSSVVTGIKASALFEDMDLYPRSVVDPAHVERIADSIRAREEIPPLIVCSTTSKIVDGYHRRRAFIAVGGDDVIVPVVFRRYASNAEFFADAIRCNSGHGCQIPLNDVVSITKRAKAFGLDDISVARAFRLTAARFGELITKRESRLSVPTTFTSRPPRSAASDDDEPAGANGDKKTEPKGRQSSSNGKREAEVNTNLVVDLAEKLAETLKRECLLESDRLQRALTELADLIAARQGNLPVPVIRQKIAVHLCTSGRKKLAALADVAGIAEELLKPMLSHPWFERVPNTNEYVLTPAGRRAVDD